MQATIRGGFDTYSSQSAPNRTFGGSKFLRVEVDDKYAFIYLRNPAPRGATVMSATLRVKARGASTGARTLTARRIADSWKARTLDGNNKPGVVGAARTATVGDLADGDTIEFDVTTHVQTVVNNNGRGHYGWRIETTGALHKLYGFDAGDNKPTLTIVWSDKPSTPTSLHPDGIISVDKPVLQFDYADVTGDDLIAVQVRIDPNANASSPAFDSGEVDSEVPELDLATTAYAGLAAGATTKWQARAKDAGGLWSNWSDWATITRDLKGTLTLDNPAAGTDPFVNDMTPPILATLTGETLTAWQIRITRPGDRTDILYDTGKRKATDPSLISHRIPFRDERRRILRDDRKYSINVRSWDSKDRVGTPGDPVFTDVWRDFTVNDDPTTNVVGSLTAVQEGDTPWVKLTWTRGDAADSWTILRDGLVIEAGVEPEDTLVSGTTHEWRDWEATPFETHTYNVKAVVNSKQSPKGPDASVRTEPGGVWIVDFDRDLSFVLAGTGVDDWAMPEQAAYYQVVNSSRTIKVTTGKHGLEGSYAGVLEAIPGRTLDSMKRHAYKIMERPEQTVQLIAADFSFPVTLSDMKVGPHSETHPDNMQDMVSFNFAQDGDLPFDIRI